MKTQQQVPALVRPSIDFPHDDSKLSGTEYTVRVSAPEDAGSVEVRFDNGEWLPCRKASGFWWYDWKDYANGEYEITARMVAADGRQVTSRAIECEVEIS